MLTKWLQKTNNIRMKRKLMISFILVVFIPVALVGAMLTESLRRTALDDAIQQTSNDVEKVKTRINDILKLPIEISNKLATDSRLETLVNTRYDSSYSVVEAYRSYQEFETYIRLYKEIANIRLYIDNPTLLNNWDYFRPDPAIVGTGWYQTASRNTDKIGWYYIGDETKGDRPYLSLVRRVYFPNYHNSGVLVMDISQTELNAILKQEQFETMVIDGNGYIAGAKNTSLVGKRIGDLHITQDMLDKPNGTYQIVYNGETSKLVIESLVPDVSSNGLKIISVFSVESIVRNANRISMFGLAIIIVSLLIATVFIFIFSSLLSKRILSLSKQINKVALGDLYASSVIDGDDEIGQLSRQFNYMVGNIRDLMEEVFESNRQKTELELKQKEIKLKMMASQINPHFLFNALESLRMKIHLRGNADIADIVRQLGKLLRKSLEIGGGTIELGEEIEMVRCYLAIQQFRFEDRLDYSIEIDPKAAHIYIPPLVVQPLVENAVIHGLENKEDAGHIRINAELCGGMLYVTVADDGTGIDEPKLERLMRSLNELEDGVNSRIGLRNVHQRLVLTYGEASGLQITSGANEWTEVRFMIPIEGDFHA